MKKCPVSGCINFADHGTYCQKHYVRLKKYGTFDLPIRKTLLDRIMDKVEMVPECGCWIWTGSLDAGGRKDNRRYGQLNINGKTARVHRVLWEMRFGKIGKGMLLCHHCDTPSCVNPHHLFLGTAKDNMQDCKLKKRRASFAGEYSGKAKLKSEDIIKIREDTRDSRIIADQYGISRNHVYKIKLHMVWAHM